ncbi:MAG: DUF1254 domain-containing protein [Spirochaetia bacterium]|jgi:hypothetical protein
MNPEKTTSGSKKHRHLWVFLITAAVVSVLGTFAYVYSIAPLIYNGIGNAIVQQGLGRGSPIPVNTFYTVPELASPSAKSMLLRTGANVDTLYSGGWLELKHGPLVLHVPDMGGRYYSLQFTDPKDGSDFAYVGRRTTGTAAGDYLITGPGWKGSVPTGMTRIPSPNNAVLLLGRVLVENEGDLATAYGLSKQITLSAP